MAIATLKRLLSGSTPIIALFVLLLASLYLLSGATHNSERFGQSYVTLLVINSFATVLLIGLIIKNLYHLIQQYRQQVTGSRLTARLVIMFGVLSVAPVSVVYYFSLDFLQRGIDSWFDVRVENALDDALKLSQASLGVRMRELLDRSEPMAEALVNAPDDIAVLTLNDLRVDSGASEMTLFSSNGRIIASSSAEASALIPVKLDDAVQSRIRQGQADVGLVPIADAGLYVRVVISIPGSDAVTEARILQVLYPVPERLNTLADSVQTAFAKYREIAYLRTPLKYSFILTLSLVLLLSILTAIWAAFFFARRMVAPINHLVDGTRAVAAGDYDKRLPSPGRDELGYLVRSFNEMTQKISQATATARHTQQQMEEQNIYHEVLLEHLSSGVLTLDEDHLLYSSNTTANHILGFELNGYHGQPLTALLADHPHMHFFTDAISPHLDSSELEWEEQVTLFGPNGRQILMCRATSLPHTVMLEGGYVIVFDDITDLMQAQRNAAWGEVARRLAHEIKNPLTPIQLSAERLRHKYLGKMAPEDAKLLDRSTRTIVQQVETLKEMVKAFSDYARMPELQLQQVDLNNIIRSVLDLYRNESLGVNFHIQLDSATPRIEADTGRLRQLLHNLIKNALEATEQGRESILTITTHCMEEESCHYVELTIEDSGPGFTTEMLSQMFEPYITSKPKGSGLGLAIVKKIVEEHGGIIWAENAETGGARIFIRLPVLTSGYDSEQATPNIGQGKKDDAAA